jgi:hypothetical protein
VVVGPIRSASIEHRPTDQSCGARKGAFSCIAACRCTRTQHGQGRATPHHATPKTIRCMQMPLSKLQSHWRKNNALMSTHTKPVGQATAKTSLHDLIHTPFLDLHIQAPNPLNAATRDALSRLVDPIEPGKESTMSPRTLLSFAFAAADQSDVDMILGMVTLRPETGCGELVTPPAPWALESEPRLMYCEVGVEGYEPVGVERPSPTPEEPGADRKYDTGSAETFDGPDPGWLVYGNCHGWDWTSPAEFM